MVGIIGRYLEIKETPAAFGCVNKVKEYNVSIIDEQYMKIINDKLI